MRTKREGIEEAVTPRTPRNKTAAEAERSLMRLCARSERCTGDALRLMERWGVPPTERKSVVERLVAQRFIDDRRYAEAYTREKSRLAGWGARKIEYQLRMKGIEREIIAQATAQLDGDIQRDKLEDKLRRKVRTTKAATQYELRGKLLRYAMTQGYDYDMAMEAIECIMAK